MGEPTSLDIGDENDKGCAENDMMDGAICM
jgi:hypothetical protein